MKKSQDKDVVLMDDATGTEIERRGVAQLANAWNGGGAMSDPDIVIAVHKEYISKGAEVIISNTLPMQNMHCETQGEKLTLKS